MRAYAFLTSGDPSEVEAARHLDDRHAGHAHLFDTAHPWSQRYTPTMLMLHCICGARMIVDSHLGTMEIDAGNLAAPTMDRVDHLSIKSWGPSQ